jgi:hypothetical protein
MSNYSSSGSGRFQMIDVRQVRPEVIADFGNGRHGIAIGNDLVLVADATDAAVLAGQFHAIAQALAHSGPDFTQGMGLTP